MLLTTLDPPIPQDSGATLHQSRQEGEGGAKWKTKDVRYVVRAGSEVLDLCECNVMEELNRELAGDVSLIAGESFDSYVDGRGGNDKGIEGKHLRC